MTIRILVVENYSLIRQGIKGVLDLEENIEVVGEVGKAEEAIELSGRLEPDVALVDLKLGGETSGLELCRQFKARGTKPRVLVYSSHNSAQDLYSCWFAGADGYLHKGEEPDKLPEVVREIHEGKGIWLLGSRDDAKNTETAVAADERLTFRERDVFKLALQDLSNKEIAEALNISVYTVKSHKGRIFKKLNLSCQKDLFWSRGLAPHEPDLMSKYENGMKQK